jgi:hypothetical protein
VSPDPSFVDGIRTKIKIPSQGRVIQVVEERLKFWSKVIWSLAVGGNLVNSSVSEKRHHKSRHV